MSGIYISGVEMPKEHPLYITLRPDGSVHVWDSYNGDSYGTQAIPVSEHGGLIDRTAFRYEMDNHYPFDKATQSRHGVEDVLKSAVLQMLLAAPIIIPADPVKEETE